MKFITSLFVKKEKSASTYEGFSDFFLNAPSDEKIAVFKEVAEKANEEKRKVVEHSRQLGAAQ